ncbi:hypothetical protein [Mesorhizobium australicum]|uniref:Uncharacterized protein n=1 Tax=Mesorhizobium australicum TaxID=536018 RepID=A0A1X7NWB9_9HYPH|nr:hypothetical protein [Mesorhizobium australicum]SMH42170.1 hypothetical protein SAMN02982922_2705 [Mesorhizobium australicum]
MNRTIADRIEARRKAHSFLNACVLVGSILAAFVMGAASMLGAF